MQENQITDNNSRRHTTLLLLALIYVFSYIDRNVIAILIEPIKNEFNASDTAMGMLTGMAFAVLYAVMGVPLGRLVDKGFSRRNMIATCCGIWSIATMACGMASNYIQLLFARMTVAVGEAGGMAPSVSMVSDLYPPHRRSLVISLFMMGPHVGLIAAMVAGGYIAQQYGWRTVFIVFGAPGILFALLLWLFGKEPKRELAEKTSTSEQESSSTLIQHVLELLSIPAFRYICLGCGVAGIAGYGYGMWAPTFLVRSYGMSLAHAGLLFGLASGVFAAFGAIFSGWYCDKLTKRDSRWQIRLPNIGVIISLPIGVAFLLWPTSGVWTFGTLVVPHAIVFAAAFGFFNSWWPSLSYAASSHMLTASQRATGAALLNLFLTLLGAGLGPLTSGILSDQLNNMYGDDGLRYALAIVLSLLLFTVVFFSMATSRYTSRLNELNNS